jgi:hypothetical protein
MMRKKSATVVQSLSLLQLQHKVLQSGYLERKQELDEGGKRATSRSWKGFFLVLATCDNDDGHMSSSILYHFRDKQDYVSGGGGRPPTMAIPLTNSTVEIPSSYTKKKFVFRLTTDVESVFMFNADSHGAQRHWMDSLRQAAAACLPSAPPPLTQWKNGEKVEPSKKKAAVFGGTSANASKGETIEEDSCSQNSTSSAQPPPPPPPPAAAESALATHQQRKNRVLDKWLNRKGTKS